MQQPTQSNASAENAHTIQTLLARIEAQAVRIAALEPVEDELQEEITGNSMLIKKLTKAEEEIRALKAIAPAAPTVAAANAAKPATWYDALRNLANALIHTTEFNEQINPALMREIESIEPEIMNALRPDDAPFLQLQLTADGFADWWRNNPNVTPNRN